MEKFEFISSAASYYAVAIAISVRTVEAATIRTIQRRFTTDNENEPYQEFLQKKELMKLGMTIAENFGLVVVVRDQFGSEIIKRANDYENAWHEAAENSYGPFHRYALAGIDGDDWLRGALESINQKFDALDIKPADFEKLKELDESSDGWAPIPLERPDEKLENVVEALEATIEELRGDNGYGTKRPEEKAYILEKLRPVTKRLKEDLEISWMYLKNFALEPLTLLIKRFGQAALGIAAASAKEAIKSWLKGKGISFLDDIL
jgi:hypothetical protein